LESYRGLSNDPSKFHEAVNIIRPQLDNLKDMKTYCGAHRHPSLDAILAKTLDPKWSTGDILSDGVDAREARSRYFHDLEEANKQILSFVMSLCYE
jgi:hypothetical protein